MNDYLCVIVTSPDGTKEWQAQGIAVPRVGDGVIVRDEGGDVYFEGEVGSVCWTYARHRGGAVVSVWLINHKLDVDHP